jgi:hypothetical protein
MAVNALYILPSFFFLYQNLKLLNTEDKEIYEEIIHGGILDDHGDCLIVDFIRTRSDTIHFYLFIY